VNFITFPERVSVLKITMNVRFLLSLDISMRAQTHVWWFSHDASWTLLNACNIKIIEIVIIYQNSVILKYA